MLEDFSFFALKWRFGMSYTKNAAAEETQWLQKELFTKKQTYNYQLRAATLR